MGYQPGYRRLLESGRLDEIIQKFARQYDKCELCPHTCGVNRHNGERGVCRAGAVARVASHNAHHGEEPPISGINGSGTIFFSHCSGHCLFCQNFPISQLGHGDDVTDENLAKMMLDLQKRGCHNINLVTPTHYLPSIIAAIAIAAEDGLNIPIVYNTSGYERPEIISQLENIIDIYLPDSKYDNDDIALDISGFRRYVINNRGALREMYRQVGSLKESNGIAYRGLIIRHLILPENLSGTESVLKYISEQLSSDIHISLMDQYFPANKANDHSILHRRITKDEYDSALDAFYDSGLQNGWIQDHIEC